MGMVLEAIDEAIRDLVAHGIYDVNVDEFKSYFAPFVSWDTDFAVIDDKYLAIVHKAEALEHHRINRRQTRGQWVGGGFGFGGSIKGAIQAGAMNAASSALHRWFNAAAKAISTVGDLMDKTTLFSDPATKMHLTNAIDELVSNTHLALVTALNDKKNITGYITSDEVAKAGRLLENVANGRVPDDAVERVLIEAVHLHPYDTSFYELWLNLFGDQNGELDVIEEFFGVSVSTRAKKDLFAAHKASFDLSTPEACERSLVDMEDYALSIGYRGFAAEKAEILMLAQQLDQERRTVAGVIYKSSQAATAAQDEIARTVKGVVPPHACAGGRRKGKTNRGRGPRGVDLYGSLHWRALHLT